MDFFTVSWCRHGSASKSVPVSYRRLLGLVGPNRQDEPGLGLLMAASLLNCTLTTPFGPLVTKSSP